MGTVRSRRYSDGAVRWFIDYVDAAGVRRREVVHVNGAAPSEARRLVRRILAEKEAHAVLGRYDMRPAETLRFADHAEDWLRRRQARVRDSTYVKYEAEVAHLLPRFGEMRLAAITRRDVEDYVADLHERGRRRSRYGQPKPLAPSTMNGILVRLKAILKDAVALRVLSGNAAADADPLPERRPEDTSPDKVHHLEPEQLERLVRVNEQPWSDLWLLLGRTGLRRGEGLGVKWQDLDLPTGRLHVRLSIQRVRRKNRKGYQVRESFLKTHYSARVVPLTPDIVTMLRRRELEGVVAGANEATYVFRSQAGGPMDPDNVGRAFKRHLKLTELPGFFRVHDLRHTRPATCWRPGSR